MHTQPMAAPRLLGEIDNIRFLADFHSKFLYKKQGKSLTVAVPFEKIQALYQRDQKFTCTASFNHVYAFFDMLTM